MRSRQWIVISIVVLLSVTAAAAQQRAGGPAPGAPPMTLTIAAFPDGGQIPVKFSQAAPGAAPGEGTSPAMTWANVPAGTQSFVLHMHDLDVARNKTTDDQVHWLVWNIPATTTSFAEGMPQGDALPDGSKQISASGRVYRGPGAPATGPYHHYTFEIYALDIKLDNIEYGANEQETRTKVMAAMQGHVRGKAVMFGLFRRPPA